jgi:hypothetical protein
MSFEKVQQIADAVLYRGGWTAGGLYPEPYASRHGERSSLQTDFLAVGGSESSLSLKVRFLQLVAAGEVEREVLITDLSIPRVAKSQFQRTFTIRPSVEAEVGSGLPMQTLTGWIALSARQAGDLFRIRLRIANLAEPADDTEIASLRALASIHAIIVASSAQFVSLTDPPELYRQAASACTNIGVWPVLAGEEGCRDCLLASPIMLSDYPQAASQRASA